MPGKKKSIPDIDLVGRIYDAALDPNLWPDFLSGLSTTMGAAAAWFVFDYHGEHQVDFMTSVGRKTSFDDSYVEQYARIDPLLALLPTQGSPIYASHELVPDDQLTFSDFYTQWLRPQRLHYRAGIIAFKDGARIAIFECQRSKRSGPFGKEELERLEVFEPHLIRALQLNQKFWDNLSQPAAAMAILDNLEIGVVLIDEHRNPTYINRYAQDVINSGNGLALEGNRLTASDSSENDVLQSIIAKAAQTGLGKGLDAGGVLRIGDSAERPLFVMIMPLRTEKNDMGLPGNRVCTVVFVSAPDKTHALPLDALQRLFGLTPAEANVVQVLDQGLNMEDIAKSLHISIHTARDHLKSIFSKTGTRRQVELVKLVLSSPASFIRESEFLGTSLDGPLDRRQDLDRRLTLRANEANGS